MSPLGMTGDITHLTHVPAESVLSDDCLKPVLASSPAADTSHLCADDPSSRFTAKQNGPRGNHERIYKLPPTNHLSASVPICCASLLLAKSQDKPLFWMLGFPFCLLLRDGTPAILPLSLALPIFSLHWILPATVKTCNVPLLLKKKKNRTGIDPVSLATSPLVFHPSFQHICPWESRLYSTDDRRRADGHWNRAWPQGHLLTPS